MVVARDTVTMPKSLPPTVIRSLGAPIPDPCVAIWSAWALPVAFALLMVSAGGCQARSEESLRNEFTAYVSGATQCVRASDCTIVSPGCPLGCEVAVRVDREAAVMAKAQSLIQEYQSHGMACAYDCAGPVQPACDQNRCAILDDSTPVRNGGDASADAASNPAD
jgi:hypothetical protein